MDILVRKADLRDEGQIFDLVKKFATSFGPERSEFIKSFNRLLKDESAVILVAEKGDMIIGYCLGFDHYAFYANGRVSWLEEIMVDEPYRRNGIGEKIIKEFENWALCRGSKLIGLATRRASSFYAAMGYEESAIFFRKLL